MRVLFRYGQASRRGRSVIESPDVGQRVSRAGIYSPANALGERNGIKPDDILAHFKELATRLLCTTVLFALGLGDDGRRTGPLLKRAVQLGVAFAAAFFADIRSELFIENLILKEEVERQERLKKLNTELVERVREVNTLNRVMEDFSTSDSSYGIFNKVVDLGIEELKADKVFFHIYSDEDKSLTRVASSDRGIDNEAIHSLFGKDLSKAAAKFILDILKKDNNPCLISEAGKNKHLDDVVNSLMVVPVKIRDNIFGVASAFSFDKDKCFNEKDIYYMSFISQKASASIENIALYENIYDNLFSTLYAFVAALEVRDLYTQKHSTRVAKYARMIAEEMDCTDEELDIIRFAGSLHDIGKIGIRDNILLKPGQLSPEEYKKIKEHPVIGADIISKLGLWDREMVIIRHHHERFDGKGYPGGLKGDEIPKLSRILCVADSFDAIDSDRAYRKKMGKNKVFDIIKENSGTQFDPEVVKAFLKVANQDMLN